MWKASAGHSQPAVIDSADPDDDWATDSDFVNDVTEQEQRWGSKTVEGSGRTAGAIDMAKLRQETEQSDAAKKKQLLLDQNAGYGYGGKFGLEKDRMDKSAMGNDYVGKVEKHASQTDYSTGFGGKFGVQSDRIDKSAVGWDHIEKVEKHESQTDHSKGFGGKFGVQEDRKDKSAVGWDHIEKLEKHESQTDHKAGFGGKFGVQSDRMDKSAVGFQEEPSKVGTNYTKVKPDIYGAKPSNLRAKFENFAKISEDEGAQRAAEQKRIREEKDKLDRDAASKQNVSESSDSNQKPVQRKGAINTGREGGIGGAINIFNQPSTNSSPASLPRKEPIQIPRGNPIVVENNPEPSIVVQQPDVIPQVERIEPPRAFAPAPVAVTPPEPEIIKKEPTSFEPQPVKVEEAPKPISPEPQIVQNAYQEEVQQQTHHEEEEVKPVHQGQMIQQVELEPERFTQEQPQSIPPLSDDLADCIEDTGVKATALYDYQAAAEDEISFDPEDLITHIEMIDEGWWRGLCKNRYGLFPANYVQLLK